MMNDTQQILDDIQQDLKGVFQNCDLSPVEPIYLAGQIDPQSPPAPCAIAWKCTISAHKKVTVLPPAPHRWNDGKPFLIKQARDLGTGLRDGRELEPFSDVVLNGVTFLNAAPGDDRSYFIDWYSFFVQLGMSAPVRAAVASNKVLLQPLGPAQQPYELDQLKTQLANQSQATKERLPTPP
jgi:hypothetical protein